MSEKLLCPCGTGDPYLACCGPFHGGRAVPVTPEALMRSRYSAYVVLDQAYLVDTWHPETVPDDLEVSENVDWRRLRILDAPQPVGDVGYVSFRAHYRSGQERGVLTETSRFVRVNGRWLYEMGEATDTTMSV